MTRTPLETQIRAHIAQCELLLERLPATLAALADGAADGYPTSVIGAETPTPGPYNPDRDLDVGPSTSVEAAYARRGKAAAAHRRLIKAVQHMATGADHALGVTRAAMPATKPAQCDAGVGREGHIIWSNPTCGNYPSEGYKTCDPCLALEDAWRVSQGLERRVRDEMHHSALQPRRSGRFTAA